MKKFFSYLFVFLIAFILIDQISGRIILNGIQKFYGLKQHSNLLIIGHSHVMLAIDKEDLEKNTGLKVSKYTREGVGVYDRYFMTKQFLDSPYSDSLQTVIYGVDQFSFVNSGLSDNSYKLFYPFMDERTIDKYIKDNAVDDWDYYQHKLFKTTRYSDPLLNASIRGYQNNYSNYKVGNLNVELLKKQMTSGKSQFNRKIEMDPFLMETFEQTMDMLSERGIRVILLNTPIVDILKKGNLESYEKIINYFSDYASAHENIEYWDFNPEYSSDYSIFYDPIHLNPKGQQIITKEINKKLSVI